MTTYLAIRHGNDPEYGEFAAVYRCENAAEATRITGIPEANLLWGTKRTGRFDSGLWTIIPAFVEEEE